MRRVLVPHHVSQGPLPHGEIHALHGLTMGTTWSVRLVAGEPSAVPLLHAGIQRQLDAVVAQMSHWDADSHLGRFNRAAPGPWHALPEAFFQVLSYALDVAADSEGAYDPVAGALVNLWGFGPARRYDEPGFAAPAADTVEALAGKAAWRRFEQDGRVYLHTLDPRTGHPIRKRRAASRRKPRQGEAEAWIVAYASQTGSAEELAQQTAATLQLAGLSAYSCSLSDLDADRLAQVSRMLFLVSTWNSNRLMRRCRPGRPATWRKCLRRAIRIDRVNTRACTCWCVSIASPAACRGRPRDG